MQNTLDTWLKYIVWTGVFMLPFLPLLVTSWMFFPFIAGKGIVFRAIVEIIFAAWVILALRDASYRPRWSWILGALVLYLVVLGLADIFGENPVRSFWSNFERMMGYITQLHLFAYFIVLISTFKTKEIWYKLANTSLFASAIVAGYSILQLFGALTVHQGGNRLDATFGNATYLAVYEVFHIFIAAYLFAQKPQFPYARWIYGGLVALHTFILINTATRGAVLGLVGGALLTGILIAIQRWQTPSIRKWALGIIIGVVVLSGGAYLLRDTALIQNTPADRLTNISFEQKTIQARFLVWDMAWQGVKEHPFLGWGQGNFMLVFDKYYDPRMYNQEPWFDRAHSVLFDTLVASGFLGLFAYLSIIIATLYYIWAPSNNPFSDVEKSVLTGMGAAYVFQNLFVFDNIVSFLLFFASLAFVHVLASEKHATRILGGRSVSIRSDTAVKYAAPIVVILAGLVLYSVPIRGILANTAVLEAIDPRAIQQSQTQEEVDNAVRDKLEDFKRGIAYGPLGRIEAREQLAQFANKIYDSPVSGEIKQEVFQLASDEVLRQIEEVPANTRYHMFHASLTARYGMFEQAIDRLKKAIETSPGRQDIRTMLTQMYIANNETEKALEVAKQSFELYKENPKARAAYALAAREAGRSDIAQQLLENLDGIEISGGLINAFVEAGDYQTVARLWAKRVEQKPQNGQFRVSYAAALLRVGQRQEAIEQLQKAIELNPRFKEQGEQLIQQIRSGQISIQ